MIAPNHDLFAMRPYAARATKPQGAVGVMGIGGAAIRARYWLAMQTKVLMQPVSPR